jgi:GTPase
MSRLVAILGRPNVGKSTLFNRLVKSRKSIVEDIPGITRDRIHGQCNWGDHRFDLIDTGGFDPSPDDPLLRIMKEQVELALDEADAVIFVMDVKSGLTPVDREIHRLLVRWKRPVFYAVNKVDSPQKEVEAYEFYGLGEEYVYFISASHARGLDALLDDVAEKLPPELETPDEEEVPHIAVVGRPNVGKSTLINHLLGQTRLLTSDVPGTTRDAVDTRLETEDGKSYVLVDTAGMRKRRAVKDAVEYYSVIRAVRSIERAHAVLLLIDAAKGIEEQDVKIANLVESRGKPLALVFNKWDIVDKDGKTAGKLRKAFYERYPSLDFVPVAFASALTGKGVHKLLPVVDELKVAWETRISTSALNSFVRELVARTPPPLHKHKPGKIFFANQANNCPPIFIFHVNHTEAFGPTYRRHIYNQLREQYGFQGSPLRLFFRKRKREQK